MSEWCLEHPWMTFFVLLAAINAMRVVIVSIRTGKDES